MKANPCEQQRTFPWLALMPAPQAAPQPLISACRADTDAIRIAMKLKPGRFADSWFADQLGISRSYLCEIKRGLKPFPQRLLQPFAYLTGSLLLTQWYELQSQRRAVAGVETDADRIARIMREAGVGLELAA